MTKPELLAPAGNLEKLQAALIYGADAVYFGASVTLDPAVAPCRSRFKVTPATERNAAHC